MESTLTSSWGMYASGVYDREEAGGEAVRPSLRQGSRRGGFRGLKTDSGILFFGIY